MSPRDGWGVPGLLHEVQNLDDLFQGHGKSLENLK